MRLPQAFHGDTHSARQLKIMWQGADTLFGTWLSLLRENIATFVALFVLLPLALVLNWRLGALLIVLVAAVALLTWFVFRHMHAAQARVESYHSALAEQAGDALGNVLLIQSFVRLAAELGRLRAAMDRVLAEQLPVLSWWALVTVLSGATLDADADRDLRARNLAAPDGAGHGRRDRHLHGVRDPIDRPDRPGDRLHQPDALTGTAARGVLRGPRHPFGGGREAGRDRARPGPGTDRVRAGEPHLPRRPPGGPGSVVRRGARRDGGAGRPYGCRQEHRGRPAPAAARSGRGRIRIDGIDIRDADARRLCARTSAWSSRRACCSTGASPTPPGRPAGGERGGARGRGALGGGARVHPALSRKATTR